MELVMDLEACDLIGGYKRGRLLCVLGAGATQSSNIKALEALNYEVRVICEEEMVKLHEENIMESLSQGQRDMCNADLDLLILDDYMCVEPFKYERKRSGKRKNANPYQSTMKRGR